MINSYIMKSLLVALVGSIILAGCKSAPEARNWLCNFGICDADLVGVLLQDGFVTARPSVDINGYFYVNITDSCWQSVKSKLRDVEWLKRFKVLESSPEILSDVRRIHESHSVMMIMELSRTDGPLYIIRLSLYYTPMAWTDYSYEMSRVDGKWKIEKKEVLGGG